MDYLDDNIITITAQESAERIDALLARCVPELTRSTAARLIEDGAVDPSADARSGKTTSARPATR